MILLAILAASLAAAAADVDETQFRYTRALDAAAGTPVRFEPDGSMYGHARVDFPDLRILDANGEQVPWRDEPTAAPVPSQAVELVARGRLGDTVTVVVDRGPVRPVIDRIALDIPDSVFVGDVEVQGSNTGAEGTYATLSTTPIYAVRGAVVRSQHDRGVPADRLPLPPRASAWRLRHHRCDGRQGSVTASASSRSRLARPSATASERPW